MNRYEILLCCIMICQILGIVIERWRFKVFVTKLDIIEKETQRQIEERYSSQGKE